MAYKHKLNDEIDLVKFINLILKYKISLLVITLVTFLFGLALNFSKLNEKSYKVTVNYSILYHPSRVVQLCSSDYKCMNKQIAKEIITLLRDGWDYDGVSQIFSLKTSSPLTSQEYQKEFNQINENLTNEIYESAVNDLIEIDKNLNDLKINLQKGFRYTDFGFNQTILKTKRIIYSIEKNGKKALYIGKIKVNRIPNKTAPTIIFSFLMGVILSILYILISNASRRIKK